MDKFRKKPVVIDAIQTPHADQEPSDALMDLYHENMNWIANGDGILIPTLEGDHLASPGDWIIKGVHGEFYPCKPDIFAATYDPADAPGAASKTLHNSDVSGARKNVKDIKVVGNGDTFQLICKASSEAEGWMKSTKAAQVAGGCLVQVTTQQRNIDGTYAVAEALAYVPGVKIAPDGDGRALVPMGG